MAVTFNPFNPFAYWGLAGAGAEKKNTTPIAIKPASSDPGIKISAGRDSITLRGRAEGYKHVQSQFGMDYEVGRNMSFTLDIDKAKTTDAFGRTDYTQKNHRIFTVDAQKGWSAEECARRLAAKVNQGDAPFDAKVTVAADGAATIKFERR